MTDAQGCTHFVGTNVWWIRYRVTGVLKREKVGRRSDAIAVFKELRDVTCPIRSLHGQLVAIVLNRAPRSLFLAEVFYHLDNALGIELSVEDGAPVSRRTQAGLRGAGFFFK